MTISKSIVAGVAALALSILAPRAFAQDAWLIGNWNFESDFEFAIQRGETGWRQTGTATSARQGRFVEIRGIKGGHGDIGTLRGLFRGPSDVVWSFIYDRRAGCQDGVERPAEVTLDPARRQMRIRVAWFSGGQCQVPTPWVSTLYRY